jgi:hypothetical protein
MVVASFGVKADCWGFGYWVFGFPDALIFDFGIARSTKGVHTGVLTTAH